MAKQKCLCLDQQQQLNQVLPSDLIYKIAHSSSVLKLHVVCSIVKCVGRFDTKKFQSSLYETEYKELLHESHKEIIEEFYHDSILSMHTSFDCFKNLESISLTLPCFQHDMNKSMGYFWKLFRMESLFFMFPMHVVSPEGVEIIHIDPPSLLPHESVTHNVHRLAYTCFWDTKSRIELVFVLAIQLPKLTKLSIIGRDPIKVGNIFLKDEALSKVRKEGIAMPSPSQ
ncbi:hypothetical protein Tco_1060289, partial [Tanacetum coccineum]